MNTVLGAAIAAVINFVTALVALFANDAALTFQMISQAAWVSMVGGAVIQFGKDYQALSTRTLLGRWRGKHE